MENKTEYDPNKPWRDLRDDELQTAMDHWGKLVNEAGGFASAYFSAKCCKAIEREAKLRGLTVENKWPIKKG